MLLSYFPFDSKSDRIAMCSIRCRLTKPYVTSRKKAFAPSGGELPQWYSTHPLIQRSPRFRVRSHTGVMNYYKACFMHLTPRVVPNFERPGMYRISVPYAQDIPDSYSEREGGNPGNSGLSSQK